MVALRNQRLRVEKQIGWNSIVINSLKVTKTGITASVISWNHIVHLHIHACINVSVVLFYYKKSINDETAQLAEYYNSPGILNIINKIDDIENPESNTLIGYLYNFVRNSSSIIGRVGKIYYLSFYLTPQNTITV